MRVDPFRLSPSRVPPLIQLRHPGELWFSAATWRQIAALAGAPESAAVGLNIRLHRTPEAAFLVVSPSSPGDPGARSASPPGGGLPGRVGGLEQLFRTAGLYLRRGGIYYLEAMVAAHEGQPCLVATWLPPRAQARAN